MFHSLANIPLDSVLGRAVLIRFSMQPNTILAIWLGLGLVSLTHNRVWRRVQGYQLQWVIGCLLVGHQLRGNWLDATEQPKDIIRVYGESILSSMSPNAVLLSYTDINWNSIRYLQVDPVGIQHHCTLLPFFWLCSTTGMRRSAGRRDPRQPAAYGVPVVCAAT